MSQLRFDLNRESKARDKALDRLEERRTNLVAVANQIASEVADEKGRVTSNDVFLELSKRGYGEAMNAVDPRWMGAVFRRGWERVGYENTGSHRRPISIWKKKA